MDLASYADLAVRLVNTADTGPGDTDGLATPEAYRGLVADLPQFAGRITSSDLEMLRLLRRELSGIFAAATSQDEPEAAGHLNALLARHPIHQQISRHDGQSWHVHLVHSGSAADQYAAGAIAGLTAIVGNSGFSSLRTCARPACHRAFIGAGLTPADRFCSRECAPPASVRRLRASSQPRAKGAAS